VQLVESAATNCSWDDVVDTYIDTFAYPHRPKDSTACEWPLSRRGDFTAPGWRRQERHACRDALLRLAYALFTCSNATRKGFTNSFCQRMLKVVLEPMATVSPRSTAMTSWYHDMVKLHPRRLMINVMYMWAGAVSLETKAAVAANVLLRGLKVLDTFIFHCIRDYTATEPSASLNCWGTLPGCPNVANKRNNRFLTHSQLCMAVAAKMCTVHSADACAVLDRVCVVQTESGTDQQVDPSVNGRLPFDARFPSADELTPREWRPHRRIIMKRDVYNRTTEYDECMTTVLEKAAFAGNTTVCRFLLQRLARSVAPRYAKGTLTVAMLHAIAGGHGPAMLRLFFEWARFAHIANGFHMLPLHDLELPCFHSVMRYCGSFGCSHTLFALYSFVDEMVANQQVGIVAVASEMALNTLMVHKRLSPVTLFMSCLPEVVYECLRAVNYDYNRLAPGALRASRTKKPLPVVFANAILTWLRRTTGSETSGKQIMESVMQVISQLDNEVMMRSVLETSAFASGQNVGVKVIAACARNNAFVMLRELFKRARLADAGGLYDTDVVTTLTTQCLMTSTFLKADTASPASDRGPTELATIQELIACVYSNAVTTNKMDNFQETMSRLMLVAVDMNDARGYEHMRTHHDKLVHQLGHANYNASLQPFRKWDVITKFSAADEAFNPLLASRRGIKRQRDEAGEA